MPDQYGQVNNRSIRLSAWNAKMGNLKVILIWGGILIGRSNEHSL